MQPSDAKVLIFDFDGTIADTFDLTLAALVSHFSKKNRFNFDDAFINELRDLPTREVIAKLHISKLRLLFYIKKFQRVVGQNITKAVPFPAMPELLDELHKRDYRLLILTSNSIPNVETFLKAHNINVFEKIYSVSNIFGKTSNLNKIIKRSGFTKANVVYIGDETRDIEASKNSGIKVVAVGWGFNTKTALEKAGPDFLAKDIAELKEILLNKVF